MFHQLRKMRVNKILFRINQHKATQKKQQMQKIITKNRLREQGLNHKRSSKTNQKDNYKLRAKRKIKFKLERIF